MLGTSVPWRTLLPPQLYFHLLLCMPVFPWWWLYPQPPEALPIAVVFPLSSQYLFDVKKDKDKVLVSLQQEDRRKYKKEGKGDNITIGFDILKVGSQQHC